MRHKTQDMRHETYNVMLSAVPVYRDEVEARGGFLKSLRSLHNPQNALWAHHTRTHTVPSGTVIQNTPPPAQRFALHTWFDSALRLQPAAQACDLRLRPSTTACCAGLRSGLRSGHAQGCAHHDEAFTSPFPIPYSLFYCSIVLLFYCSLTQNTL